MKRLLHTAFIAALAAGFWSCDSGGGSGSSVNSASIVGMWDQTRVSGWIKGEDGTTFEEWDDPNSSTFVFEADGSGSASSADTEAEFTWKLTGTTLALTADGGVENYTVEKAALGELVLASSGSGQYLVEGPNYGDPCTYCEAMTFRKR